MGITSAMPIATLSKIKSELMYENSISGTRKTLKLIFMYLLMYFLRHSFPSYTYVVENLNKLHIHKI